MKKHWSEQEIEVLKTYYKHLSIKELQQKLPGRSYGSIQLKALRLSLQDLRYTDLAGQHIGHLYVICRLHGEQFKEVTWATKCDCGKESAINTRSIQRMTVPSCGCQRPLHTFVNFDPQKRTLEYYLGSYKRHALENNREWQLTEKEFKALVFNNCFYCGIQPNRTVNAYDRARFRNVKSVAAKERHKSADMIVNGIDRRDSTQGYTIDNCVTCCKDCNYAKRVMSVDQFFQWIERVYEHSRTRTKTLP